MDYVEHRTEALVAWPSQRDTAGMLGVDESTLSRRGDIEREKFGEREVRLAPSEVLRLADTYRRRPVNAVAGELIERARVHGPQFADEVRAEVDSYFAGREPVRIDSERFLLQARRTLPRALYEQVELAYQSDVRDDAPVVAAPEHRWAHT